MCIACIFLTRSTFGFLWILLLQIRMIDAIIWVSDERLPEDECNCTNSNNRNLHVMEYSYITHFLLWASLYSAQEPIIFPSAAAVYLTKSSHNTIRREGRLSS
ncbi:hypothetical protein CIPAW_11G210800 [Carya illinoinensis]|uniref:Uncharacterized protein n=1 Tax=Carya illinoinensis TaxID=32201 RepID=A0A8T1P812_CARIL|nr:hypothetical protein CIPAW_11G210800 [Carya illinoinensis]